MDALGILPRRKRHKKLLLVCPYASADLNTSVVDMLSVSKLEDMFFASWELGHSLRSYMNWTQFQIKRATAVAQWDGIHVRHVIGNVRVSETNCLYSAHPDGGQVLWLYT